MPQALSLLAMLYAAFLGTGVSGQPPSPAPATAKPPEPEWNNCPDKCGDVQIPYPFGVGPGCFLAPEFELTCNETTSPPSLMSGTVKIANITLETAQMVVYTYLTYSCNLPPARSGGTWQNGTQSMILSVPPFLVSPSENVFTAVGCSSTAIITGQSNTTYLSGCITTCTSVNDTGNDGAPCRGHGCCESSITPNLSEVSVDWELDKLNGNPVPGNPCQYAFIAKKGWYNFSRKDLTGNMTFANRLGLENVVPLVLDWAISDGTCPPAPEGDSNETVPYGACVSSKSYCVSARNGAPGYFCNCSKGYTGNPYIKDGCTNINECELRESSDSTKYKNMYPCHGGTCKDVQGDYECKCNFGRRGDGKSDNGCGRILPKPALAVIGTIFGIAILVVLLIYLRNKQHEKKLTDRFEKNGGQILKDLKIKMFSEKELIKMTKNYAFPLGRGNFGEVFMGNIRDGDGGRVAVKRYQPKGKPINEDRLRAESFANEIKIQSQISHRNLVQLVGCCLETEVPTLVYELVTKGSLSDVLHKKKDPLPLETRLDIAISSAVALAYLHSEASQKVLHGDVKSDNILLDDNFIPKVSDFGTSRLMSIGKDHTSTVIGDNKYIDPVYLKEGLLTEKSDVYSFGIVLLELVTRKAARYDRNNSLPINYVKASRDGTTRQIIDKEVADDGAECLEEVGKIAMHCLNDDVDHRPTMVEVTEKLKLCKSRWIEGHGKTSELSA